MANRQTSLNPQLNASLKQRIASLSPAQQQLFRQQLEAKGIAWDQVIQGSKNASKSSGNSSGSSSGSSLISRLSKLPLSASQKQLWVFQKLHPSTSAYHIAFMLTLKGSLIKSALHQSLQSIVDRHEALRTIFLEEESRPYAKVLPALGIDLPIADLRDREDASEEVEIEVQRWQHRLVKTPFDLERGLLLRAQLLEISDDHFELIVVLHHLIADGWSRGILLRELSENYRRHTREGNKENIEEKATTSSALPPLSIQYADYVLQQEQWLESEQHQHHRAYWQRQLADLSELDLPGISKAASSGDRQNSLSFASKTCTRTFSAAEIDAIKTLAKRSGTTTFMLLLAIFKLLLHRYSRQSDIAVGVPVAGRSRAEVEPLIGFFVNTLVVRSQVDSSLAFSSWLRQVQSTFSDALQHQDISFPEVVEAVGAPRIPGRNPLFRVMFQVQSSGYELQNAEKISSGAIGMPGLSLSQQWIDPGETKFDMSWHVIERDGQLLSAVEYRAELFAGDHIQTMLDSFHTLVAAIVDTPDQPLSHYSLLSETEKEQIIQRWSRGESVTALKPYLPARFEQQVEKTPDAIALRRKAPKETRYSPQYSPQKSITYRQLNHKSNKIAHWLLSTGLNNKANSALGSACLVGVCLHPGIDLVAALLAVLKTGSAYIPLDSALPEKRLRYMVEDANPAVIIAHRDCLPASIAAETKARILYLDSEIEIIAQSGDNPNRPVAPDDLAYVIYTSGSTGQPKGTQLTHGGLINYLDWCLSAYPVSEGCGAPVQSSIGFDATITSLFAPLLAGKQVVFYDEATEVESLLLALSGGFSFIKLTPSHLSALQPLIAAQRIDKSLLPKALIIGGEALHAHHISYWREHFSHVALFNEYGPTEAVVGCCVHRVSVEDCGNIPIGRPIDGVRLYALDEQNQLVPSGVPSELHIGGAGVAKGYLNQPALTAERFVEDSFATELATETNSLQCATKLYRTGDLVVYGADGCLEYLGRIDTQVKLRGFRIELGEIEQAVLRHPQIEQAAVVIKESEKQNRTEKDREKKELVAYIVVSGDAPSSTKPESITDSLKQHLSHVLPTYMMPAHIVALESLPLNANGKIDTKKLPAPAVETKQNSVDPRNRRERILLEIWQQILGIEAISIYDNFFDLGGDSISGMQIVSKARMQGLQLTPAQLFEHQTIAAQAAIATEISADSLPLAPAELPAGPIPLSPIQQDLFDQELPNPHHYNQSLLLDVQRLDTESLQTALNALVNHHDALRLRFQRTDSGWTQQYMPSTEDLPIEDIAPADKQNAAASATHCQPTPPYGHPSRGDLLQADLFNCRSNTALLEEITLTRADYLKIDEIIADFQASLNITAGPLFRGVLLHLEDDSDQLLLVAHHLVVDGVSWRISLSDLVSAYEQAQAGQAVSLPAKSASFGEWTQYLDQQSFEEDLSYWTRVCGQRSHLPVEIPSESNRVADERESLIELSAEETAALQQIAPSIETLLLTALSQTLTQWSAEPSLVVDVESHGRQIDYRTGHRISQNYDLSRTVGWFTSRYPVPLLLPSGALSEQVDYVSQQLSQTPHNGISYGVLRTQHSRNKHSDSSATSSTPLSSPAEVSFNYLGQTALEKATASFINRIQAAPASRSLDSDRQYLFEIIAVVQNGQLQVRWRYSQQQYQSSTVERLAQRFASNLLSLITFYSKQQKSEQQQNFQYKEKAFAAARVDSSQLNQLMGKLQRRGGRSQ